jgi:hypothetical protein
MSKAKRLIYLSGSLRGPVVRLILTLCTLALSIDATAITSSFASGNADCQSGTAVKPGFTRAYIALRNGQDGSGKSPDDARDGSSTEKFDRILRCYSEGCKDPASPQKSVGKTDNLIVCLGPGLFQTEGSYDYVINVPHTSNRGFALGKGWKVHGSGVDKTTVQLSSYLPARAVPNPRNVPVGTATGVVFSTSSDDASDIEVSDLTIDANYPELKSRAGKEGIRALNLEAVQLRSDRGHNWIHDINVLHTSGEIGTIDEKWETFPVWIYSVKQGSTPQDNSGNVIERVNMTRYGGGQCTAIAVANATAEVRNNKVEGYQIGYGGWALGAAHFHDNIATGTEYGFNIDSLVNRGVVIERNLILQPRKYGIVIGGSATYANFVIKDNTIQIDQPGVIGLVLQGNVTGSLIQGNSFLWRGQSSFGGFFSSPVAIRNYSGRSAGANQKNSYQDNKISSDLKVTFSGSSRKSDSCFFQNRDESGKPVGALPDSSKTGCITNTGSTP